MRRRFAGFSVNVSRASDCGSNSAFKKCAGVQFADTHNDIFGNPERSRQSRKVGLNVRAYENVWLRLSHDVKWICYRLDQMVKGSSRLEKGLEICNRNSQERFSLKRKAVLYLVERWKYHDKRTGITNNICHFQLFSHDKLAKGEHNKFT